MKNILVTGSNGQLGSEIQLIKNKVDTYFFTDISNLDIGDTASVELFVEQHNIQIIINCAGYTNVDKAEDDFGNADLINHISVANLANICKKKGITLIHISTDYVFSGEKNTPYTETDTTKAINIYGETKLNGKKAIQKTEIEYIIIRTSWLYSLNFGNNFVKKIQQLSSFKKELKVVIDQVGTPTNAHDLATFIIHIIENNKYQNKQEVYHFSNEGVCSWYDFAKEIVLSLGRDCVVHPCLSSDLESRAKRPHYSVLDKTKLKKDFNYNISHWKESFLKK